MIKSQQATRQTFVPSHYVLIAKDERYGFEVYGAKGEKDKGCAMAFSGKRSKPDWHIRFRSEQSMHERICSTLNTLMQREEVKKERRAKRFAEHDVKVGDVFSCSWGWEQTNVQYFEITELSGKSSCKAREIRRMASLTGRDVGECVPMPGNYIGEEKTYRINMAFGEPRIRIYSFSDAYRLKPVAIIENKPIFQAASFSSYA